MKRAAEKLKNTRGASILLALLFVLVCMTVGASVLMAASANAGRTRSNHEEQQFYLALSSALQMVVDDLTNTTYTAKVDYTKDVVVGDPKFVNGTLKTPGSVSITHTFNPGTSEMNASLANVFQPYLDEIVNTLICKHLDDLKDTLPEPDTRGNQYTTIWTYNNNYTSQATEKHYILSVKPEGPLNDYEVQVQVDIREDLTIALAANITGAPDGVKLDTFAKSYRLTTELGPTGSIKDRINEIDSNVNNSWTHTETLTPEIKPGPIKWTGSVIEGKYSQYPS